MEPFSSTFELGGGQALDFTIHVPFFDVLTLVPLGFRLADPDENFKPTVFEVTFKGNQRFSGNGRFCMEFENFFFMQEEAADTFSLVVFPIAFVVGGDVKIVKPSLTFFDTGKSITEIALAIPDGFDFGALEFHSGLEGIQNGVVVAGFTVINFDDWIAHFPQVT
jgi:hypothetical protein